MAAGVSKAKRGHSKDGLAKDGSDCPLVTLVMALDASGFVQRVQFFAGNASEPATLKDMLTGLHATPGEYFSPSWTAFQADRGRCFSGIVDGILV